MNEKSRELLEPVFMIAERLVLTERTDFLLECVELLRCAIDEGCPSRESTTAPTEAHETLSVHNRSTDQKSARSDDTPPDTFVLTASQAMAAENHDSKAGTKATDGSGLQLGPYELLEMIGEGGMGTVYRAEQKLPIQRTVAIKMARTAMNSPEVLHRFELERQTLAKMDHEGIARLLEAGQTSEGLPFFVMEFVEGQPVTEFCREHRTTLMERLKIFLTICDAIQHAHQRGILHRDVKPGNVLAAAIPGSADVRVKVIDFGLAKVLDEGDVGALHQTIAGQVLGTVSYMSPEQAGGNPAQVDLRSDVYSLGALLFELLTDTATIDVARWKGLSLPEVLQHVKEVPLPLMSHRLLSLGTDSLTALQCTRSEMEANAKMLSGDLDLIVAKAVNKDVRQRYQSVSEFAEDVRRYIHHLPVMARKPSLAYTSFRFVQRHKLPVAFAATLTLASMLALGSWVLWTKNANADLRADLAESRVQEESVARMLSDSRAELAAEKSRTAEASLKTSERDRIILQLAGSSDVAGLPQERIEGIDQAIQLNVMDDSGRCELQLAKIDILFSMQRFDDARSLAGTLHPVTPEQAAMVRFWNVRMSPALAEERIAARELLDGESAVSLAVPERLFLTALTRASRAEAIGILEQLLQNSPRHIAGRKLLLDCLLFEGRHEDVLHQASILRILQPDDPETEIAVALASVMLNSETSLKQQIERLRELLPEEDMNRITPVLEELSRTSSVITQWDSGGLRLPDLLKTVAGLSSVLDSFAEDVSVLDSGLNALVTGLNFRDSSQNKASMMNLGVQFGGRFLFATGASALGNYQPIRALSDDLAAISPFEHDAFFHFLKALTWIAEDNFEKAVVELELADQAPCVYRSLKPETLYCLAMSWTAIYNKDRRPESLQNAVAAADRWVEIAKDIHGGRVGNLLPIWKGAGRYDQALRVLDTAERMNPASRPAWNELRMHVYHAAGRHVEAVRLSDQLSLNPDVTPQQRESFSEIRRVAKEHLGKFVDQIDVVPE